MVHKIVGNVMGQAGFEGNSLVFSKLLGLLFKYLISK